MGKEVEMHVSITNADDAIKKASNLVQVLKEARTLAGELASDLEKLEIDINFKSISSPHFGQALFPTGTCTL